MQGAIPLPSATTGFLRWAQRLPVFRVAAFEIVASTAIHMFVELSLLVKLLLLAIPVLGLALLVWKTKPVELERIPRIEQPGFLRDLQDVLHMYVRFFGVSVYHRTLYARVSLLLNLAITILNATFLGTWEVVTLQTALMMAGVSLAIYSTLMCAKVVADPSFPQ